jgi:hypothetical protein
MAPIKIESVREFSLGGEKFVIEVAVPPKDRRPSTSDAFTIAKNEPYLRVYEELPSDFLPRSILELGIFQGGSYVFLDKLFKPGGLYVIEDWSWAHHPDYQAPDAPFSKGHCAIQPPLRTNHADGLYIVDL